MGRWELGGKQSVLAKVIPHIPTDSQEKKKAAKYSDRALGLFLAQRRETMTWWDNGWFLIVKQENEITFAHHWPVCPSHARVTLTQTLSLESSLTTLRWASVRMWWYSQYSFHQVSGLTNLFIHDIEQHSFNPQFKDSNVCLAFSSRLQFSLNLKQKSWEMIKQCGENQSMWLKWRN